MNNTLSTTDPSVWGVAARGAELVINPEYNIFPHMTEIVIDVENNPDGSCAGIGITCDGEVIHFFEPEAVSQWPKDVFKGLNIIGHNVKYDVQMLRKWGFDVSPDQIVWDTQIFEYVKDSTKNRYGLKHLVKELFGSEYPEFEALTGKGTKAVSFGSLSLDIRSNYNGCDVLFTHKIAMKQFKEVTSEQGQYMETIEMPAMRVILEMEERGVLIDANYIRGLDTRFGDELSRVINGIRTKYETEINLNSWQQIKQLLLDKAGLRVATTSAEELEKHKHVPLVKDILRYRGLAKLRNTYTKGMCDRLDKNSRLHTRFNQTQTHTGRLSSCDPNLQNIPTRTDEGDEIRQGFIAPEGSVFVDADYSQIEPRLMAHFSQDPVFMRVFKDGLSIYEAVIDILDLMKTCNGDKAEAKRIAKVMWLALAYNAGAFKLSKAAGISLTQAQNFINKMKEVLSHFFFWRDKAIAQAEIDGGVKTLFGRFIPIPAELAHLGPNYIIQGSAAEVNKLGLVSVRDLNPVLNVHDEIAVEALEKDQEEVKQALDVRMSTAVILSVPIKVSVGSAKNWRGAKN